VKKLIASLLVAFLMSAGLVAVTGSATNAAPRCPYTGCVKTVSHVNAEDKRKPGRIGVDFRIGTRGNAEPIGVVRVIVTGNEEFRAKSVRYPFTDAVNFSGLDEGRYQVEAKFIPNKNSAFARSDDSDFVTVK
jgi:hypothetical protein